VENLVGWWQRISTLGISLSTKPLVIHLQSLRRLEIMIWLSDFQVIENRCWSGVEGAGLPVRRAPPILRPHRMIGIPDLIALVEGFVPDDDPQARDSRAQTLALLRTVGRPLDRGTYAPGHVTASGLVLSPEGDRVLLVFHRRLQRWLQPGGHVEPSDADIVSAARREVREETAVELDERVSAALIGIDVHSIPASGSEPGHLHHDLVFRFVARSDAVTGGDGPPVAWCRTDRLDDFAADPPLQRAARRARTPGRPAVFPSRP
jgi:8-oxo-dGTP pyrophosphatase MutT (NUDIX family)